MASNASSCRRTTIVPLENVQWPVSHSTEIPENRLLLSAQWILGPQVSRLMTPPRGPESVGAQVNWFDESRQIGIPVAAFPRWMVCSKCRLLAPLKSGLFEAKSPPYRPDKARYVHNCNTKGQPPLAIPARFLVTCDQGHLDDFPWLHFVHRGAVGCNGPLRMFEYGPSGEMADVMISCDACGAKRRLAEVMGPIGAKLLPACTARRPHLRDIDPEGCKCDRVRPIALGASNTWFSRLMSARDFDTAADLPEDRRAPISRKKPTWIPASETRGEGIFFQFSEAAIASWVKKHPD